MRGLSARPTLQRGRWEESAVHKWASCFHHSCSSLISLTVSVDVKHHVYLFTYHSWSFPTASTTSTTACGYGELHPTSTAGWRPTTSPVSPLQQRLWWWHAHSEHRFPAPSSKLCQIWLRHWTGTLYLRAAVRRRGQLPPKVSGTNMTVEAT